VGDATASLAAPSPGGFPAILSLVVVAHFLPCGRGRLLVLHDDKPADIDPVAKEVIRRKARYLKRRGGFSPSDLPDLEQELWQHLLNRMPTYDPSLTDWEKFASAVVTAWAANCLRDRFAAKRDPRRLRPLPTTTESDQQESVRPEDMLSGQAHDARLGIHHPSEQERLELQLDVREALENLPADLRRIAERLQHITPAELARELGMPRTTLYGMIERIRRRFERWGLGKNL
jgi:RNA polymerase sigma-70 factor, ECF subfamily